jgi:hypothetical protein
MRLESHLQLQYVEQLPVYAKKLVYVLSYCVNNEATSY